MRKERIKWIDLLKGFAIMLMVLAHTKNGIPYIEQFVYMFHMPVFFILSGYCLKSADSSVPKKFFIKKVKGLYWPYLKWCLLFLICHNSFCYIHIYDSSYGGVNDHIYQLNDYMSALKAILTRMRGNETLLGGYWFLNALFIGNILAYGVIKWDTKPYRSCIMLIALAALFNSVHKTEPILGLCPQKFVAAALIVVGYSFRRYCLHPFNIKLIILCLLATFIGSFFWRSDLDCMFYDNDKMLPYLILAVVSSWSFCSLFQLISNFDSKITNMFGFIGRNTLTILTWHFVAFKIVSLFIIFIYQLPIGRLAEHPVIMEYSVKGWWVAYLLIAMIVTAAIACSNRYIKSSWLKL